MKKIKKKVLYITEEFPYPLNSGGKIKTYHTLQALYEIADIYLVCISKRKPPHSQREPILKYCSEIKVFEQSEEVVFKRKPLLKRVFTPYFLRGKISQNLKRYVDNLLLTKDFDAIHIDHLWMAMYLDVKFKKIKILEAHNVESDVIRTLFIQEKDIFKKVKWFIEFIRVWSFEFYQLKKFDVIWAINDFDRVRFKQIYGIKKDMLYVSSVWMKEKVVQLKSHTRRDKKYFFFMGRLDWPPNAQGILWFIENVWIDLVHLFPDVELVICSEVVPTLFFDEVSKYNQSNIKILVNRESVTSLIQGSVAVVIPIFSGSGVRYKILDSLRMKKVIISSAFAILGTALTSKELFVAKSRADFLRYCKSVLLNSEDAEKRAKAGKEFFIKNYGVNQKIKFIDQYQKLLFAYEN